jgi:hypothetical protein
MNWSNMSGLVENVGRPGENFNRSEGRAYSNVIERIDSFDQLTQMYLEFSERGRNEHHRRRIVFRARCSAEVAEQLSTTNRNLLPVEVMLPLSQIHPGETDFLVTLGENVHPSEIPEWEEVYQYWQNPNGHGRTPSMQIERLNQGNFRLTNQVVESDVDCLTEIWRPFGWTREGVLHFIQNYQQEGKFFSGVVDPATNTLVSASMAEGIELAGIQLIEGTEYGTLPGHEGHGYCTAAVVGLHAQILQHHRESGAEQLPLILSEFSMTSRSDIVGRHAGMTIPLVEGTSGLENTPIQVLRYNVSVLDRRAPNSISWRGLGDQRNTYRDAFRTMHRYWRNFIVGVLPAQAIEEQYSPEQIEQMLSQFQQRS